MSVTNASLHKKPPNIFVHLRNLKKTLFNFNNILRPQCVVYCQLNCQLLVKCANLNNSYSGLCEKHKVFSIKPLLV